MSGLAASARPELPTQTRRLGEPADALVARVRHRYGSAPLTDASLVDRCARRWPMAQAVVSEWQHWTFGELQTHTEYVAAGLRACCGVAAKERVALLMSNRAEYIGAFFGLTRANVVVPINTRLSAPEIGFILNDAGIDTIVTEERFLPVLSEVAESRQLQVVVAPSVGDSTKRGVVGGRTSAREFFSVVAYDEVLTAGASSVRVEPETDEEETAAVYYTSGTTGLPKGAELTHQATVVGAFQYAEAYAMDSPTAVHLTTAPLFHVQFQVFIPSILQVGGSVVVSDFSPARVFNLIRSERVTAMFAVPSMLFILLGHEDAATADCTSVQLLQYGGSPMPSARLPQIEKLFPNAQLLQGFGQTESTGLIAVSLPGETTAYPLSTGRAISGTEIRIVNDRDAIVGVESQGEIIVQGPQVMKGYLGNSTATADTIKGGWLHTGDVGYLDEEGRLYVVDRKKDMIIRGGENIYPAEVEEVILRYPGIDDCAVVAQTDEVYQEVPVAFITVVGGTNPDILDALRVHCETNLARYKVPAAFHITDGLPRTASGKIQKFKLRKYLAEGIHYTK